MINHPPSRHRPTRHAVLAILAAVIGSMPCLPAAAEPFDVPALANPATGVHFPGKLVWLDLESTDLPAAKAFYRALLGWEYRDYHAYGVDYTVALVNGAPVAGLVRRPILNETERPSAWLPFFSVADVEATFTQAVKAHATVRSEPEDLPLRGRQARLTDPEGATFALVHSTSGDPSDDSNPGEPGTWGAPSLLARDPAGEAVFYQTLFRYAVMGTPADAGFERIRLSAGKQERADVRPLPVGGDASHPQWIGFVRVSSAADAARRAVKLGGRILVEPTRGTHGAFTAILEDPTGAAFGVIQRSPDGKIATP